MRGKQKNETQKGYMDELYTSKNFGTRLMHRGRLNQLLPLIPINTKKLLEIGCGGGHLIQKVFSNNPDIKIMGVDKSKEATDTTKEKCKEAEIITADISTYDFGERKFDTIICTEVLEHIENYGLVIKKMEKLLEKGGTLILSFPNERNIMIGRFFLGRKPIKIPEHINSFKPSQIIKEFNLKLVKQQAIPRGLPFFLSIAWIIKLEKREG